MKARPRYIDGRGRIRSLSRHCRFPLSVNRAAVHIVLGPVIRVIVRSCRHRIRSLQADNPRLVTSQSLGLGQHPNHRLAIKAEIPRVRGVSVGVGFEVRPFGLVHMANVHIRFPSQCGAGREIKSGVPLLRLLRDGVGMVEGRGYREVPGPPASMEFVGLGVQLVQLLAL
jgi:hypothetical protein